MHTSVNEDGPARARRVLAEVIGVERGAKARAAREMGVSLPTMCEWLDGGRRPRDHHREIIERWTGGRVPAVWWVTEEEAAKIAAIQPRAEAEPAEPAEPATGTDGAPS